MREFYMPVYVACLIYMTCFVFVVVVVFLAIGPKHRLCTTITFLVVD